LTIEAKTPKSPKVQASNSLSSSVETVHKACSVYNGSGLPAQSNIDIRSPHWLFTPSDEILSTVIFAYIPTGGSGQFRYCGFVPIDDNSSISLSGCFEAELHYVLNV
jgi:hypothetical protein